MLLKKGLLVGLIALMKVAWPVLVGSRQAAVEVDVRFGISDRVVEVNNLARIRAFHFTTFFTAKSFECERL